MKVDSDSEPQPKPSLYAPIPVSIVPMPSSSSSCIIQTPATLPGCTSLSQEDNRSPLWLAARSSRSGRILCSCEPNLTSNHGFSISGVVKLLLQHGADPGRLDKDELSCADL